MEQEYAVQFFDVSHATFVPNVPKLFLAIGSISGLHAIKHFPQHMNT